MIVYSKQVFFYILEHHHHLIECVYLAKDIDRKLFSNIKNNYKGLIEKVDTKKAQAMARGGNHQGFLMKIALQDFTDFRDLSLENMKFVVVLSGVTDMGNIGSIARTAYCLGVDALIVTGVKSLPLESLIRTSVGAFFNLPVVCFKDTLDLLTRLSEKDFTLIGATLKGKSDPLLQNNDKKALVMGGEGDGLSQKVLKKLDKEVTIKMTRAFDSLNVSNAAAILIDRLR